MTPLVLDLATKACVFGVGMVLDQKFPAQDSLVNKAVRYAVTAVATAVIKKVGEVFAEKVTERFEKPVDALIVMP